MRTITFLSLAGLSAILGGCGDSAGPDQGVVLESVTPAPGSAAIDPQTSATVRFSGAMGMGMEQYIDLHQGDVSGPIMAMNCAWSAARTTLTCMPATPLVAGTSYTMHLGGGMTDGSGHHVEVEHHGMDMGGQPVTDQMMGGMHGGQPMGMMGQGWLDSDGHLGMAFAFTTQ